MITLKKTPLLEKILDVSLSELFFPIYHDIKNINEESNTAIVSRNNWELMNEENKEKYQKVITELENAKKDDVSISISPSH